jgi:hypothetical protein
MNIFRTEPAVVLAALVAIINVAVSYGVISDNSKASIIAAVTAIVPLIAGFLTRAVVTPVAKA